VAYVSLQGRQRYCIGALWAFWRWVHSWLRLATAVPHVSQMYVFCSCTCWTWLQRLLSADASRLLAVPSTAHNITHHFNSHFPGEPGLAGCPDLPSPFVLVLCILSVQSKSFYILSNTIPPCLSWVSLLSNSILPSTSIVSASSLHSRCSKLSHSTLLNYQTNWIQIQQFSKLCTFLPVFQSKPTYPMWSCSLQFYLTSPHAPLSSARSHCRV